MTIILDRISQCNKYIYFNKKSIFTGPCGTLTIFKGLSYHLDNFHLVSQLITMGTRNYQFLKSSQRNCKLP